MPRDIVASTSARRRPRLRRLVTVLGIVVGLVLGAAGVYYWSLPGTGDAEARVQRGLAVSHGLETGRLPRRLAAAFVAVEDRRYYEHGALDVHALARAISTVVGQRGVDPGGSTITQQLAKLLYPNSGGIGGGLGDVGVAFRLERRYSKAEILEMYLTSVYLGDGFYGARRAALGYYHRPPERLSWAQASMIAGLAQAPSAFDPRTHLLRARHRQSQVVAALVATRRLSTRAAREILQNPGASAPAAR